MIHMTNKKYIYERKSCRSYSNEGLSHQDFEFIRHSIDNAKRLDSSIEFRYEILAPESMSIKTRWKAPYYLAIYSEQKGLYKQNIGFVFEQVTLDMLERGIGSCWVGMASPSVKKPDYVISIAFGKSNDATRNRNEFKRKELSKICDVEDERLIPANLAPSAVNAQPWYFKSANNGFDVYQVKHNPIKRKILGKWGPVDVGIALSHLYLENEDTFTFIVDHKKSSNRKHIYVGSISF